jgi:hypothetical protein
MPEIVLKPYWIAMPQRHIEAGQIILTPDPIGFGVTAFSLPDAIDIMTDFGIKLPDNLDRVSVSENVEFETLPSYVKKNMGPMIVRGLWFPFFKLGTAHIYGSKSYE